MNFWKLTKHGRVISQLLFLSLTAWITIQFLQGVRGATVEKYCPFGGIETLIPWLGGTGTLCSLSTVNISMMAGVIILTILFKRVFCSHVCPLGSVLEWLGVLGRRFVIRSWRVPPAYDRVLRWIKYLLVALIVYFTARVGELVFRDYDPYYVLFTAGKGHEISHVGLWVTLTVLIAGIVIPLSFCRYLCPLGACLAPVGRFGLVRIFRNQEKCTGCRACDDACERAVPVSEKTCIDSAECVNCQDCLRACPVPDTLTLGIGSGLQKL